jgi:xanthine dehydrogenase YagS FAD-binding subunit
MQPFEYIAPTSVANAVKALSEKPDAAVLAGGTDLVNRLKDYVAAPSRLINVKRLVELEKLTAGGTIGAGVTLSRVMTDYACIAQAIREVGTPQIRNMATVGGNLLQRPRCWYYRNGYGLVARDPQGKSLVREGDNRYGPIFMTEGDALFVNCSSLAPPLIALDATVTLVGPKGERTIPVADLYRVPKGPDDSELAIDPAEVLTTINLPSAATPPPRKNNKTASYEVRLKQSHDWPLVLCSVALTMDGDTVKSAKVVLGSVAPIPLVCEPAAKAIIGKKVTAETAEAAGKAATEGAKPLSMNAYKVKLTQVAIKRALLAAVGQKYWEA